MTLTKNHIIKSVQDGLSLPRKRASELVETLSDIIKNSLANGEDVLISGFGKFCVKDKGERKGRNPATGGDMILAKRRVVTFKCSSVLRKKVNRQP